MYLKLILFLLGLSIVGHGTLLEVENFFAHAGGSFCCIAGPIDKRVLEALYARAVRMLLHQILQSCDLPSHSAGKSARRRRHRCVGAKLSILYQLQFAYYNRSSLDSCSLFKVAQTNSDVAIGDVHKIRNNL